MSTRAEQHRFRLQGIACALGALAREQMEPDLAAMVLDSLGLTVADLAAAGADAYDLAALERDQYLVSDTAQVIAAPTSEDLRILPFQTKSKPREGTERPKD
jgi:hypothetical protein